MGELLLVALVLVLFFGAKKLPEFFHALGKSISEFKRGRLEEPDELERIEKTAAAEKSADEPELKKKS